MRPSVAIFFVMLGCCTNVVCLELLTRELPGCGNIVTFFQFLFIAIHGFVWTMRLGREKSMIPIRSYFVMVSLFFVVSVMNNYALNFGIPMPLHMIFKGGSLVANMLMGMWVLGRFYSRHKYVAVVLVTIGIIMSTYCSTKAPSVNSRGGVAVGGGVMTVGVLLLLCALLLSARLGIFQEVLYRTHGRHSQQALFFTHALPLPGFLLLGSDIVHQGALMSASQTVTLLPALLPLALPKMWIYLAINVLTQYVCISSVFHLTERCTSLTVTLVVTLRKFASLLFSVWYFNNTFMTGHWLGAGLVFLGTFVFVDPCALWTTGSQSAVSSTVPATSSSLSSTITAEKRPALASGKNQ